MVTETSVPPSTITYSPKYATVSAISQALPCVVTTSPDHTFSTGEAVRMIVPKQFGMVELDEHIYSITVLSSSTFSLQYTRVPEIVDVNSTNYTPYIAASGQRRPAQALCIGALPIRVDYELTRQIFETLLDDQVVNIGAG